MACRARGLVWLLLLSAAACGDPSPSVVSTAPPDTTPSPDSGADGGGPPPAPTDAFTGAAPFVSTVGNTPHNAGMACNNTSCHDFLVGGTVYKDYKGKIPAPGVEVRVRDTAGNALSVFTGDNGNFYIANDGGLMLPAVVGARDGTTTRPMVTTLTGAMGSCAAAGCHVVGGTPTTGAYYPIHVP